MVGLPTKPGHVDLLIDLRLTLVPVETFVEYTSKAPYVVHANKTVFRR